MLIYTDNILVILFLFFFFQVEDGIRYHCVTGVQTCALPIFDIEKMPRGILFWRCMTHWLGGMGIVTLALAIFPAFGVTAYQMFRGEVPGRSEERRVGKECRYRWSRYH